MRVSWFVLGLVAAIGLLSCQKEITSGDPDEPAGSAERLLTKYSYSQSTQSWTDTFFFDPENRVTRINEIYIDSSSPSPSPYNWFWEMHYNGSDKLPNRITDTSQGRDMNWYILYDAQKRKTVDSIVYLGGDRYVTYYTYQGNQVVAKMFSTYGGNPTTITSIDTLVTDGSNWVGHAYVNPIAAGNNYHQTISYDNHPNPFSTLNIMPAAYFDVAFNIGDFTQSGKNNATTLTYIGALFGGVFRYQYVYDAEGYPVSSFFFEESDPAINGGEKFVYKK